MARARRTEQLEPQQILQPADLMAERRRRDVQLLGRLGEAGVPGGGFEGPERIQGRQRDGASDMSFSHLSGEILSFVLAL